ncbi:MAG: HlyD family type I secretion periplasmic adaptor subunit [Phyllobacterium sp.]
MAVFSFKDHSAYEDSLAPALWGVVAMLVFVLLFVLWGYLAPLSTAAIAEGSLQVQVQRQSVQHPYGGVVSRLLVAESQHVERGQPLIELDDTDTRAKMDVAKAGLVALLAEEARLICERDGRGADCLDAFEKTESQEGLDNAIANERAVLLARMQQYSAEKAMLSSKVAQLKEKIFGLSAQVDGLTRQGELLDRELAGAKELQVSGFTPLTRVLALERNSAELLADRGSRVAETATSRQEIDEAELAVARLERERISDITDQIRKVQSALAEARPKLDAANDVMRRIVIKAPMSGSIVGLSVFTEGGVVQAGARLMDIVPDDTPIIVEARLPLSDINEISPGLEADVKLTGIPRKDRPHIGGKVISVSADKITDTQSGTSYFALRVELNQDDLLKSNVKLQAGMPVEVVIATSSRTLVSYLFGPLLDEIGHAFREQ